MQTLFNDLRASGVRAEDGIAGRMDDLFFDDRDGSVLHAVIVTGKWPRKKRVVIDPDLLTWEEQKGVLVAQSCAEIARAPHPDAYPPVSRQLQLNLDPDAVPQQLVEEMKPLDSDVPTAKVHRGWSALSTESTLFDGLLRVHRHKQMQAHLRSIRATIGYGVEIEGGRVGKVADVWLDTSQWRIDHLSLCLDATGQRVAVPLSLVRGISLMTQTIRLSASWSHNGSGFSLEPLVAPPRERHPVQRMRFSAAFASQ